MVHLLKAIHELVDAEPESCGIHSAGMLRPHWKMQIAICQTNCMYVLILGFGLPSGRIHVVVL